MALLTATSELEAVNRLLEAIEEERVNTLTDVSDPDVRDAQDYLMADSRSLQLGGWEFNTEEGYTLSPDINNRISIPADMVKFTVPGERLSLRSGRVFDRSKRSYTFTSPLTGTAIFLLGFDDLPEAARSYVVTRAAFRFQAQRAPDALIAQITSRDVEDAYAAFVADDTRALAASFSHHDAIQNRRR